MRSSFRRRRSRRGDKGLYVYVVDEHSKAQPAPRSRSRIRTRKRPRSRSGVNDGEKVVTSGAFMLQPGAPVTTNATAGS